MATKKAAVVEHSKKFDTVKGWYDMYGQSVIGRVKLAVEKGWITAEEYEEITGEKYNA